jgi:hypothetical protein
MQGAAPGQPFDGSELRRLLADARRELESVSGKHAWLRSRADRVEVAIAQGQVEVSVLEDLRQALIGAVRPPQRREVLRGFPEAGADAPDRQLEANIRLLSWIENHSIDLRRWQSTDASGRSDQPHSETP